MHDIGKIGIPDAILLKPGKLTAGERKVVQEHAAIGAKILENSRSELIQMAHDVALTHHEKWDGSGYPSRLAGKRIPLVGRIVGLADVFDALVSRRCYKPAYPLDKALEILRRDTGRHFDPEVADAFFTIIDGIVASYPPVPAEPNPDSSPR